MTNNAKYNSKTFNIWSSKKKIVFENTNDVQIAIDNLTIIDYPEEEDHVKYVEFTQTYNSDLLKQTSQKNKYGENLIMNGKLSVNQLIKFIIVCIISIFSISCAG